MPIDSPHNARVKLARSLHAAKGRQEAGLFLAEGPGVVAEALRYASGIAWVAWCPELGSDDAGEIADAATQAGIEVLELSQRAFRALSDTRNPQGIAAVIRLDPPDLTCQRVPEGPARVLVLHEVQDPGNAGTMIRTADAFGAAAVMVVPPGADPYEPKVVRATAGSLFHLPVVEADWRQVVGWARASSFALVAAGADASCELGRVRLPERAAIVIGNEAHGLPQQVLQDAALKVRIPMPGRAESLNAAVAAGVLLYEAARDAHAE